MAEADFSGVPLRMYLDLEQGSVADLVAVSQASIAFANGVKEIAFLLDPTLELKVGITPELPGSLWRNTLLSAQEEYENRKVLYQLAAASVLWFLQPPLEKVRDDWWRAKLEMIPNFTDQEQAQVRRVAGPDVAEKQRQEAYRWLGRDQSIVGFSASIEKRRPPADLIIPRSEFDVRSGRESIVTTDLERTTTGPLRVILVSPVLDVGARRWKFATAQGEFGAAIRDEKFLRDIVSGNHAVPLRAGIEMDIELETREKLIAGVWQIVERNVVEVRQLNVPASEKQQNLFPTKDAGDK